MASGDLPQPGTERERYLRHSNTISNVGYVQFLSSVIPLMKRFCPAAKEVLDYGCGHVPVLVALLKKEGYRAVGYDRFFFPELPESKLFDSIVSVETIEHFFQPARELVIMNSLLKREGCVIAKTQILHDEIDFRHWWYVQDFTHTFFYRIETFEWIAENWDWQLVYSDHREHVVFQKI